jgi:signal transduction histidine kinase/CheY-like chemotaxis protein
MLSPAILASGATLAATRATVVALTTAVETADLLQHVALVLVLTAAAVCRYKRWGKPEHWATTIGVVVAAYLTSNAHAGGGAQNPELIWLLALPMMYVLAAPDQPQAIAACAVSSFLGVGVLYALDGSLGVYGAVHLLESGCLGVMAIYAARRNLRLRDAQRQTQRERELVLERLADSERKRAEAERMAGLGRLAAGVGHEINNPLTYVVHNLEYARESIGLDSQLDREALTAAIREARDGAKRIKGIVEQLRLSARPEREELVPVDPRIVLDGALRLIENQIRQRAKLVVKTDGAPAVRADPGRLSQVFVNMLANAADAVPTGDPNEHEIGISISEHSLKEVLIEIWDTGSGIPPNEVDLIFQPAYTTKTTTQGTGLGLAISKSIIEGFGGRISVKSDEGRGTRFSIVLRKAHEETIDPAASQLKMVTASGKRILIIDDEPEVLAALARGLGRQYEVDSNGRADEALARLDDGADYDLIICDLMMPEMDGMTFYGEFKRRYPGRVDRIVFISGGVFEPRMERFLNSVANARIEKPCDLSTLRQIVAREISRAA